MGKRCLQPSLFQSVKTKKNYSNFLKFILGLRFIVIRTMGFVQRLLTVHCLLEVISWLILHLTLHSFPFPFKILRPKFSRTSSDVDRTLLCTSARSGLQDWPPLIDRKFNVQQTTLRILHRGGVSSNGMHDRQDEWTSVNGALLPVADRSRPHHRQDIIHIIFFSSS